MRILAYYGVQWRSADGRVMLTQTGHVLASAPLQRDPHQIALGIPSTPFRVRGHENSPQVHPPWHLLQVMAGSDSGR